MAVIDLFLNRWLIKRTDKHLISLLETVILKSK